jgi:putative ABC transport system permease protein
MNLFTIVRKNLRQRALSSTLTALSIALGVAVTVAILALKEQGRAGFSQGASGYDLIVGAKGSKLQLVLNTIYHVDDSTGTVPWSLYEKLRTDRRVKLAVPMAVGDYFQNHRLVGTSDRLFLDFEVVPGQKFELASGRFFTYDEEATRHIMTAPPDHPHDHEEGVFEAVVGARAAADTGLALNASFVAQHGSEQGDKHEESWKVVGILKPSGTPADRAIFINLDSFFHIKGHTAAAEVRGKISTIVLKTRGRRAAEDITFDLSNGTEAMGVAPADVIAQLFDMIGKVDILLLAVAILVVIVAGVSILVSIYNSMADRKRSIAIMRALGARRSTLFAIIVLESTTLCAVGGLVGALVGHVATAVAANLLHASAGVLVSAWRPSAGEPLVYAGLLLLGALVGLIPAWKAYRTDIAEGLNPTM